MPSSPTLPEETGRRLTLAVTHLGWSGERVAGFREGYVDALSGRENRRLMHRHDFDAHGVVETGLSGDLRRSLGYREGVQAAARDAEKVFDYGNDVEAMRGEASCWSDAAERVIDMEAASWSASTSTDLSVFLGIMSREEWISWFIAENQASIDDGRDGYADLLIQDIKDAAVYVVHDDGENQIVHIWDGWHRIGASMLKNAPVPTICGIPSPTPAPAL